MSDSKWTPGQPSEHFLPCGCPFPAEYPYYNPHTCTVHCIKCGTAYRSELEKSAMDKASPALYAALEARREADDTRVPRPAMHDPQSAWDRFNDWQSKVEVARKMARAALLLARPEGGKQ